MKNIILTVALLLTTCCLNAQDWTTAGGNNLRNGQTNCTGCTELNQLWSYQYDEPSFCGFTGYICENKCVTTHFDLDIETYEFSAKMMCFKLLTGELLWEIGDTIDVFIALGFNEGHVYAINWDNQSSTSDFYSINAETHSVEWILEDTCHCGDMDWWNPVFTSEGNLLVSGVDGKIICLEKNTGDVIWETDNTYIYPNTGGTQQCCIVGDKVYALKGAFLFDLTIVAIDISNGSILYESESIDPQTNQQIPITVSEDRKIFVMLQLGGLVVYQDTGSNFVELWYYPQIGGIYVMDSGKCNFGLSQDEQFIYTTDGTKTLKLRTDTGELIAQSDEEIAARFITVDNNDNLFVSNLGTDDGCYYCLDSELNTIWQINSRWNYSSGISIGGNNIMIIPMTDSIVAYQTPFDVDDEPILPAVSYAMNYPNPLREQTAISYFLKEPNYVTVDILNIKGQYIKNLTSNTQNIGEHSVMWYGKDELGNPVASGIYLCRIVAGNETVTRKMILMK